MNEIALTAQALMARGIYRGVVITAEFNNALPDRNHMIVVEGAGSMQLGRLVGFLFKEYLKNVPEDRRETMARWMAARAVENASTQTEA